jgi:hypothetical protein
VLLKSQYKQKQQIKYMKNLELKSCNVQVLLMSEMHSQSGCGIATIPFGIAASVLSKDRKPVITKENIKKMNQYIRSRRNIHII